MKKRKNKCSVWGCKNPGTRLLYDQDIYGDGRGGYILYCKEHYKEEKKKEKNK